MRARSRAVCMQRRPSRLRAPREPLACSRLTLRLAAWRALSCADTDKALVLITNVLKGLCGGLKV